MERKDNYSFLILTKNKEKKLTYMNIYNIKHHAHLFLKHIYKNILLKNCYIHLITNKKLIMIVANKNQCL